MSLRVALVVPDRELWSGQARTVIAKTTDALVPVHEKTDAESAVVAQLEPGVLGSVKRCNTGWCYISGRGYQGWVQQVRLWGVYPNEKVE